MGRCVEIVDTTVTRTPRRFDQRSEIAIAGKQHDLIDMLRDLHGVDSKLDIHVALHLARGHWHQQIPWLPW
jgi:hypothetical protein